MDKANRSNPQILPPATPLYLHCLVMAVVILPCIVVSQFAAHWEAATIDDPLYAFCGWRIWQGATLYLDVWDHKPPGLHWIDAVGFAIGRGSYAGVIGLCTLAAIASHILFFLVANAVYHRGTAALATILACLYLTHGQYFAGSNRAETFLVLCELALILLYVWACKNDRRWVWYAAGLCGGAALLVKQTGLAAMLAAGLHTFILVAIHHLNLRAAGRRLALMLAGCATVVAATAIVLAVQGALGEAWFAVFTYNRLLLEYDRSHWFDGWWWSRWLDRYAVSILLLPLLMAAISAFHAMLWRLRPAFRPPQIEHDLRAKGPACPHAMTLFGLWYFLALAGAVSSPNSLAHHFLPTLPPLLLLAGYLINVLKTELGLLPRLAQRAWVIVAFVLIGYFASDAAYLQFQKAAKVHWDRNPRKEQGRWTMDKTSDEQVGELIARITSADDTIQCWDYSPAVYLHARRANASRFLTAGFSERVAPGSTTISREFQETLERGPPKVIVMAVGSYMALCEPGPTDRRDLTPTGRWLKANYKQVPEMTRGHLYVLLRKDAPRPASEAH